ncbi:MAG: hypothetical protein LBC42_00820, partial [Puniceicoccales bacterium]|nr:hypothetical protein [Puniceicoccales bacterium]
MANVIYKSTKSGHYSNGRAVISTAENVHQCMIDECLSMPAHEIEIILHDFEKNKLVEVKGIQRYSGHFTAIVDIISL